MAAHSRIDKAPQVFRAAISPTSFIRLLHVLMIAPGMILWPGELFSASGKSSSKSTSWWNLPPSSTTLAADDAESKWRLGERYRTGNGVKRDYAKAKKLFLEAAALEHPDAYTSLGNMLLYGQGERKNEAAALARYRSGAALGSKASKHNLAQAYIHGWGTRKNVAAGISQLRRTAAENFAPSMLRMGNMYDSGTGVPKSEDKAIEWYGKAANLKSTAAMISLGRLYERSNKKNNYQLSSWWYGSAAQQGDVRGMVFLAERCTKGLEGPGKGVDQKLASDYYLKAAKKGSGQAQYEISLRYLRGTGIRKDINEAAKWLQKSAGQGYAMAEFILGTRYDSGAHGFRKNAAVALKWLRSAADHGEPWAQSSLGMLYRGKAPRMLFPVYTEVHRRRLVRVDQRQAAQWLTKAAQRRILSAQMEIADMYLSGSGVRRDSRMAYEWLRVAAESGSTTAKKKMAEVKRTEGQRRVEVGKAMMFGAAALGVWQWMNSGSGPTGGSRRVQCSECDGRGSPWGSSPIDPYGNRPNCEVCYGRGSIPVR